MLFGERDFVQMHHFAFECNQVLCSEVQRNKPQQPFHSGLSSKIETLHRAYQREMWQHFEVAKVTKAPRLDSDSPPYPSLIWGWPFGHLTLSFGEEPKRWYICSQTNDILSSPWFAKCFCIFLIVILLTILKHKLALQTSKPNCPIWLKCLQW